MFRPKKCSFLHLYNRHQAITSNITVWNLITKVSVIPANSFLNGKTFYLGYIVNYLYLDVSQTEKDIIISHTKGKLSSLFEIKTNNKNSK